MRIISGWIDDSSSHQHPVDPQRVAAARAARLPDADAAELVGLLGVVGEPLRARIFLEDPRGVAG